MRIGHGYDIHPFCLGRPLVLGGVRIPYAKGLHGHSDADVLTHAICDAILGAAGLRDIGFHFPDDDPGFENIDSLKLLGRVVELAKAKGYRVENVDATVIAEKPKLQPHIDAMEVALHGVLVLSGGPAAVNIKATTSEGLGFIGRGEGIAAHAVALLSASQND
ncbi:2-C-methyl-D-erythritol 2,4-cyclodiphosphate synthase [Candidatus Sumerlaeota bacterium]|nr:2-C-methyl-D-erythritol 2,4-cyclodiphosphate synthase [Candidatus Sumerlaeota bacterium]